MTDTFLWVKYLPAEVDEGYWEVYKRLVLPGKMLAVFFIGFVVALGYVYSTSGLHNLFFDVKAIESMHQAGLVERVIIAGLCIPAVLSMLTAFYLHSRVSKSYESRPNFHFPIVYVIQDGGLSMSFVSGQGTLDWSHLTACVESAKYFCLVSTPSDVFVLPKRCLSSDSEVNSVRQFLVSKVRTYLRHAGKDIPIAFEKVGIELVYVDGLPVVQTTPDPADPLAKTQILSGNRPIVDFSDESIDLAQLNGPDATGANSESTSGAGTAGSGAQSTAGEELVLDIGYKEGEVQNAEKIYYFRKRLPHLALQYLSSLGWILPSAYAISYIWGQETFVYEVFQNYGWLTIFALPFFLMHALYVYLLTLGRARISEEVQHNFVFTLSEEGCGVRSGDRYAVLSWWHFEEIWESQESFMLLFGRRGRAMYVIPKRAFDGRVNLAFTHDLLKRKVRKVLVLE